MQDVSSSPGQFSAKLDGFSAGPPTQAPVARIRDVLVCPINNATAVSPEEFRDHPPIGSAAVLQMSNAPGPASLGQDLQIAGLPQADWELVMNACTPRGHYFVPVRQFGQRYSIVREVSARESADRLFRWDPDGVISDALMLSRLIRDNGHSLQYAARIADYEGGEQMVMYSPGEAGKAVYRLRQDRDWLDADEGRELQDLLAAFWQAQAEDSLPPRVRRALLRTEYGCWFMYADALMPMVVSGLEALLKVGRDGLTRQFVQRAVALADELSLEGVTEEFCSRMYDGRSDWVHGSHVRLFATGSETPESAPPEGPETDQEWTTLGEIATLQDLLRAAVRRSIEEPAFRETFASDEAIRDRWPT